MEGHWKSVITNEGLSRIQAVARGSVVQNAATGLAVWGVVNVGAWFFSEHSTPSSSTDTPVNKLSAFTCCFMVASFWAR